MEQYCCQPPGGYQNEFSYLNPKSKFKNKQMLYVNFFTVQNKHNIFHQQILMMMLL